MNLSDVNENAIKLENELLKLEKIINDLQGTVNQINNFTNTAVNILVNKDIVGGQDNCVSNARAIKTAGISFNNTFLQNVRAVKFHESIFILANLKNKYEYFNIDDFIDIFLKHTDVIHTFTMSKNDQESSNKFLETYTSIQAIIQSYRTILEKIKEVKLINSKLCNISNANNFKIRLLNENNNVSNLLESITIIKSMYDTINILIGDDTVELEYKRVESGSLEIILAGCGTCLAAFVALLTFLYNFYAQNFSWKAKQEKLDGEIKIRGSIIKTVKEYGELKPKDQEIVQKCFAELESNGKKLFINNPLIKLNNEEIGLKETKNQAIPKSIIETEIKKIEERQIQLEDKEEVQLNK